MADLSIKWAGLTFKNPLVCASGPITDAVDRCETAAEAGFGGIVLKSILYRERVLRYQQTCPRFKIVDRYNQCERWTPDKGFDRMQVISWGQAGSVWLEDEYGSFINKVKQAVGKDVKVGASVIGDTRRPESFDEYFDIFSQSDADFVEIDMGHRHDFRYFETALEVVRRAKQKLSIPVGVKIYNFVLSPPEVAKALQDAGADGITMFDMAFGLDFNIDTLEFAGVFQGTMCNDINGDARPYVFRAIAESRKAGVTAALTACWGIQNWKDVIKTIMCGGDMAQIHRQVHLRGYKQVTEWLKNIEDWLDKHNYKSIAELKGKILPMITETYKIRGQGEDALRREEPLERGGIPSKVCRVDTSKCKGCINFCIPTCFYFALKATDRVVSVDETRCGGCGTCQGVCPHGALLLEARV